jgi:exosortase
MLASTAARLPIRALAFLAIVWVAYRYSLEALAGSLTLQTPLAYLGLVPLVALVLAWFRLAREPALRPIHDRQLDYIIAVLLLGIAGTVAILVPATLGARFWLQRLDLLSLPFFVAGLLCLFYGVRYLWLLKLPIGFLFLAWPVPYEGLLAGTLDASTRLTTLAAIAISGIVPTAQPSGSEGLFIVQNGAAPFALSIGSACAGVNSVVGYLVVGGGAAYLMRGARRGKVGWLVAGAALIWILNLVRIEVIFLAGALAGQDVALDVLHPLAGLLAFNLGLIIMLAIVEWFGLALPELRPSGLSTRVTAPVRRVQYAFTLGLVTALALGLVNSSYARFQPVAGIMGNAQELPFDSYTAAVAGWRAAQRADYAIGRPFFGDGSSWERIVYRPRADASLRSDVPLYVDVIATREADKLAAFNIEACYSFHGFTIINQASRELARGVVVTVVDYLRPQTGTRWSALWWEWPYRLGDETWYERVVLLVPDGPNATYAGLSEAIPPASPGSEFADTERFLLAIAGQMLDNHFDAIDAQRSASR